MKIKEQKATIIAYFLCHFSFLLYSNNCDLSTSYQCHNVICIDNEIILSGNSICFEINKSIMQAGIKDSLRRMPYHSIYIEAFDYNSLFSINYENSIMQFNRFYIIPRIGLNFVPIIFNKKLTAYTFFLNTSYRVFHRFFFDAGIGFSKELEIESGMTFPLAHFGLKFIGRRGLFLRLSYLECIEPYIGIGSCISYNIRQVDVCIGYSFGRKKL